MAETIWKTAPVIKRYAENPILSAKNVPGGSGLVFNAGVAKYQGRYVMLYRHDLGDLEARKLINKIQLGLAFSYDGIKWEAPERTVRLSEDPASPLFNAYDPRLTVVDDRLYLCFACYQNGTRGGVAVSDDLENWEVLSITAPDNRNMVLFPERINGRLVRLERPFAGYLRPNDPFDIWLSTSADGRDWGSTQLVLGTQHVPWVNNKIGPGAPPVRTERGWLAITHGVDLEEGRTWGWSGDWNKRYSGGLMLLDLENPARVIGLSEGPVLVPEPEYEYEARGYRDYVIFPGGMIAEPDGSVKIYYGAADTVECLATSTVDDLLALIKPVDLNIWR